MEKTYRIALDESSITCLLCGMTSHNRMDVLYRYCGNCEAFHGETRCDFCMAPDVKYAAEYHMNGTVLVHTDFIRAGMVIADDGVWMACLGCKILIEAKRWDELVERGSTGTFLMHPEEIDQKEQFERRARAVFSMLFGDKI
jgi:hypothetical protein